MSSRGSYIPLSAHPSPSLSHSKLFHLDTAPRPEPQLAQLLRFLTPGGKGLFALLILAVLGIMTRIALPSPTKGWARSSEVDLNASWDELFNASRGGWRAYEPRKKAWKGVGEASWTVTAGEGWTTSCLEDWARGDVCEELKGTLKDGVDLLWTWTNGSDPLLRSWRVELTAMLSGSASARSQAGLSGRVRPELVAVREKKNARHFREHDELRYSLRSATMAFLPNSINKITLLTTDLPTNSLLHDIVAPRSAALSSSVDAPEAPRPLVSTSRVGQVPTWLIGAEGSDKIEPRLEIVHHHEIFKDAGNTPTFNSLAIEASFAQLEQGSEFVLYMNDDTFLLGNDSFTAADIGSPLYGPIFRLQRDFVVDGKSPSDHAGDLEGEWPGLRRANWLLNRRFGKRNRGYLAHLPKTFSPPLLAEMQQLWSEELAETASSRFRGRKLEYTTLFLATHYVIESHRQALLYSYLHLRADTNLDGSLSLSERQELLSDLGFINPSAEVSVATAPLRSTVQDLPKAFEAAGLERPRSTEVLFDSRDGFAMMIASGAYREGPEPGSHHARPSKWPVVHVSGAETVAQTEGQARAMCSFSREKCLGLDFLRPSLRVDTWRLFRRVAFELPECGDCAILLLMYKSGLKGLDAFLPLRVDSSTSSSSEPTPPPFTPLGVGIKDHTDLNVGRDSSRGLSPLEARGRAMRLIRRYSYAVGDTPSKFVAMKMPHLVDKSLRELNEERRGGKGGRPALLTLNDDMQTQIKSDLIGARIRTWFSQQWPTPSAYEQV